MLKLVEEKWVNFIDLKQFLAHLHHSTLHVVIWFIIWKCFYHCYGLIVTPFCMNKSSESIVKWKYYYHDTSPDLHTHASPFGSLSTLMFIKSICVCYCRYGSLYLSVDLHHIFKLNIRKKSLEEVRGLLKNRRVLTQPQENDGREQDIDTLVIIVTVQYWEFWLVEFLLTLNST